MQKSKNKALATMPATANPTSMATMKNMPMVAITTTVDMKDAVGNRVEKPMKVQIPAKLGNLSDGAFRLGERLADVASAMMTLSAMDGELDDVTMEIDVDGKLSIPVRIPHPEEDEFYKLPEAILTEIREHVWDYVHQEIIHPVAYALLLVIEGC